MNWRRRAWPDVQMPCSGLDARVVRALTSLTRLPPNYPGINCLFQPELNLIRELDPLHCSSLRNHNH
jgi:hypothetical protein